jgi:hypothetical protein
MESQAMFIDIDYARSRAYATTQPLIRFFNSAGTQVYSYCSFNYGLHYEAIERLRKSVAYATIEAPHHDATGWGMKG